MNLTAEPENGEKSSNSSGKEACVNVHRRLRNQSFFFITLETAEPENRETATNHSGKGACVYATYRDRSVCAVACSRDCITGSICLRFLFALRYCLNHSLFYPDDFVSCVCRVLNIDEGTEISDRVDMHHASYQSTLSSTHHPEISSSTRRHSDFIRRRSYTPYFTLTSLAFAPHLLATLVAGPLITTLTKNSCTLKCRRRNHHNHSNLAQINCVSDLHQTTTAILI